MGSVVVDASVILGVLDPGDSHHASATRALKRRELPATTSSFPPVPWPKCLSARVGSEPTPFGLQKRLLTRSSIRFRTSIDPSLGRQPVIGQATRPYAFLMHSF